MAPQRLHVRAYSTERTYMSLERVLGWQGCTTALAGQHRIFLLLNLRLTRLPILAVEQRTNSKCKTRVFWGQLDDSIAGHLVRYIRPFRYRTKGKPIQYYLRYRTNIASDIRFLKNLRIPRYGYLFLLDIGLIRYRLNLYRNSQSDIKV